jgi:branched-chain amino acid aminotransferase
MSELPLVLDEKRHAAFLWRNGSITPWELATIHVAAVGHASVSAVFEGIKAYWNPDKRQLYVFHLHPPAAIA